MLLPPLLEKDGSATGDLITDKCHEPCGDELTLRLYRPDSQQHMFMN